MSAYEETGKNRAREGYIDPVQYSCADRSLVISGHHSLLRFRVTFFSLVSGIDQALPPFSVRSLSSYVPPPSSLICTPFRRFRFIRLRRAIGLPPSLVVSPWNA